MSPRRRYRWSNQPARSYSLRQFLTTSAIHATRILFVEQIIALAEAVSSRLAAKVIDPIDLNEIRVFFVPFLGNFDLEKFSDTSSSGIGIRRLGTESFKTRYPSTQSQLARPFSFQKENPGATDVSQWRNRQISDAVSENRRNRFSSSKTKCRTGAFNHSRGRHTTSVESFCILARLKEAAASTSNLLTCSACVNLIGSIRHRSQHNTCSNKAT